MILMYTEHFRAVYLEPGEEFLINIPDCGLALITGQGDVSTCSNVQVIISSLLYSSQLISSGVMVNSEDEHCQEYYV